MEKNLAKSRSMVVLLQKATPLNLHMIISFLDSATICDIVVAFKQKGNNLSLFHSFVAVRRFVDSYITKTDRSMYMPFYSEPTFLTIQNQHFIRICSKQSTTLSAVPHSFALIFSRIKKQLHCFSKQSEVVELLEETIKDPQLPFPKLRKQNIGMHCNSVFQFFLVEKLFPNGSDDLLEEIFEQLKVFLEQQQGRQRSFEKSCIKNIFETFNEWYKINLDTFENYLMEDETVHNMIVLVLTLIDLLIDSLCLYIETIDDPFHRFIEFNLRYCIFRNLILSLEEKIGFLFDLYTKSCQAILKEKQSSGMQDEQIHLNQRPMKLWHCALSKWYIYMQRNHKEYNNIFFYMLKKSNLETIEGNLQEKIDEHPILIQLLNKIEMNSSQILNKEMFFQNYSEIEEFFDQNKGLYSQVIKQYTEYLMDISINEYSVHWCGHSNHKLHTPYQQFETTLSHHFEGYIDAIFQLASTTSHPHEAISTLVHVILQELDKQYLKSLTLKKIVDTLVFKLQEFKAAHLSCSENPYAHDQLQHLIQEISHDINRRDQMLEHFNGLAKISNQVNYTYNILIETQDFLNQLKKSATTTASKTNQVEKENQFQEIHARRYNSINSDQEFS